MQETTKAMACPSNKARHLLRGLLLAVRCRCRCRSCTAISHEDEEEQEEEGACLMVDVITESVSAKSDSRVMELGSDLSHDGPL